MDDTELEARLEAFVAAEIDDERCARGVAEMDSATNALLLAVGRRVVRRGLFLGYVLGQAGVPPLEAPVAVWPSGE